MRGKVKPVLWAARVAGITPARAGKRHARPDCPHGRRDHPCVCGEKPLVSFVADFSRGSPPRMRGKGSGTLPHYDHQGITPACAGKSLKLSSRTTGRRDHPRVCGEKRVQLGHVLAALGSPPRVRGKAVHHKHRHSPGRITPAHAGKRTRPRRWVRPPRDHPRACGEKITDETIGVVIQGSPPRMRGKAVFPARQHRTAGITPACAGKRTQYFPACSCIWEHPRVCGEKFHPASDRKLGRVRGTKRSSGPAPAAAPAGLAGSCPASPPWSYPPRITVSRPRP